ncbi:hypothetical protein S83_008673, partial [Arachis hypogaea]
HIQFDMNAFAFYDSSHIFLWSGVAGGLLPMKMQLMKNTRVKGKKVFTKYEWFNHLLRIRNDALIIISIICLQLPFELAYAHLYEVLNKDIIKFGLTAIYLATIQYITKLGGKVSVKLIMFKHNENPETRADSLVYKVFGLYFMQTYIGICYHALLHQKFGKICHSVRAFVALDMDHQ